MYYISYLRRVRIIFPGHTTYYLYDSKPFSVVRLFPLVLKLRTGVLFCPQILELFPAALSRVHSSLPGGSGRSAAPHGSRTTCPTRENRKGA